MHVTDLATAAGAPTEENSIVDGTDATTEAATGDGAGDRHAEWAPSEDAPRKKRHIGRWVGIGLGVLVLGLGAASTILIAPGTAIAGVQVGGMTPGAAAEAVSNHLNAMQVTLTGEGGGKHVTGSDLGAHIDATKLADKAFADHPMWNITSWMSAPIAGTITLDDRAAEHALRAQVPTVYQDATDATVAFQGTGYAATPAKNGSGIDLKALTAAIAAAAEKGRSSVAFEAKAAPVAPAIGDKADIDALPDPASFLQLLSQACRLIEAGIFVRKSGAERWVLVARLGQNLPKLDSAHPLIEHVLETREVAHIAQAGLSNPQYNQWVFAAPLRQDLFDEVDAVLAVHTMPFMAFDDINLRRLQVLASSYADFTQLELLVEDVRAVWPESPIGMQQEWAHLAALHEASGLRSYCALWMGQARLSEDVLDEFAGLQPPESSWWRLQTHKGHLVLAVLLPIIGGASLTAYRREMIDSLETILARQDQPKQTIGVDFYPVRHAADYAE
ncbi:MAG: hypothetical protein B7X41_00935, partial [Microbacterium sp. 14-71-5]